MSLNGGYAMIKYNSTQEELQIAYRSKKPALFYDENQRAHWAVIEETATESVDEETQEPITLYEYSYRLIDEASSVVANPTLSGNEATLNGLEVDGTKYKVGGGKEYLHIISISYQEAGGFCLNIKTNTNTPFTCKTLISYLKALGYINMMQIMPCAVYSVGTDSSENTWMVTGVFCFNNNYLGIMEVRVSNGNLYVSNGSTTADYPNFSDTVTEV